MTTVSNITNAVDTVYVLMDYVNVMKDGAPKIALNEYVLLIATIMEFAKMVFVNAIKDGLERIVVYKDAKTFVI